MKTLDTIHHYRGYWHDGGICRLRIFERDGALPIVVATELPHNTNTSVTNISERLAAEVLRDYLPQQKTLALCGYQPFVWVEHYPQDSFPERFSLVTYSTWIPYERMYGPNLSRPSFGVPRWEHVGVDRIEELTGQPWPPELASDYLKDRV